MKLLKPLFRYQHWLISVIIHVLIFSVISIIFVGDFFLRNPPQIYYPVKVTTCQQDLQSYEIHPHLERVNLYLDEIIQTNHIEEPLWEEKLPESEANFVLEIPSSSQISPNLPIYITELFSTKKLAEENFRLPSNLKQTPVVSEKARPLKECLTNNLPEYPLKARELGQQGLVILKVTVNIDGMVEEIEILSSSGYSLLDNAAINAVKHWRFIPAKINGTPTKSIVKIPIRFKLQ